MKWPGYTVKAHTHYSDLESADLIDVKILNMFDTGSQPTITKSAVVSADSGLESADSTTDSPKVGMWYGPQPHFLI